MNKTMRYVSATLNLSGIKFQKPTKDPKTTSFAEAMMSAVNIASKWDNLGGVIEIDDFGNLTLYAFNNAVSVGTILNDDQIVVIALDRDEYDRDETHFDLYYDLREFGDGNWTEILSKNELFEFQKKLREMIPN